MNLVLPFRRHATAHLDEKRIVAFADDSAAAAGWSAADRTHLRDCPRCGDLLARHQRWARSLRGPWDLTEMEGIDGVRYGAPVARGRLAAAGLGVVAAAVVCLVGGAVLLGAGSTPQPRPRATVMVVAAKSGGYPGESEVAACDAAITTYGEAHSSEWGGLGSIVGGGLVTAFTGHLDEHVRDLRALLPAGCPTVVAEAVTYTWAQLTQVQDSLTADWSTLRGLGAQSMAGYVDVESNRVRVSIYPLTPAIRAEIERGRQVDMLDIREEKVELLPLGASPATS